MFLPALHMYFGISLLIVWFGYQGIGPTVMVVFNNKNVTYYILGGGGELYFLLILLNIFQFTNTHISIDYNKIKGNDKKTNEVLYFSFFNLFKNRFLRWQR